ncbi:carboxypeptidase-like regulatory domain-containing protein [Lentzea fradiae]|uniref:carboxypeptidase-like regulatory domain-containing protein n=1 Tax=Lentzea fradiae TaxID=200378 RepID=UPI00115FE314|nr:carboxypeptidase-like regulatory domain-containing protein [Lentzea fradiae]
MTTAVVLLLGTATIGAHAQDDPSSAAPTQTETATPSSDVVEPSTTTEPPPPSSSEASTPPESPAPPSADPSAPATPPTSVEQTPAERQNVEQERATAQEDAQQAAPDLKVSLRFDREYGIGEPLGITLTVRNDGDAPAHQVRFATETLQLNLTTGVEDLISRPDLAPGEQKVIRLGGTAQWGAPNAALTVRAWVEGAVDKTPADNQARAEAKIVNNTGTVSGVLFEDRDGNGVAGPGEGVDWQTLRLSGGPEYPVSGSTYNGGQFAMYSVPPGTYQVSWSGRNSNGEELSVKPGQFITVKQGETTRVAVQVVPSLSRSLWISGGSFGKQKYAKGERVSVSVTVHNRGTAPITGLVTVCDPENDPATLDGTGDGWGDLRPDRGGVTVAAGETKTFTVTDTVPDAEFPTGKVYFACVFSVDGRNVLDPGNGAPNPGLTIGANVAGTRGSLSGHVLSNGSPVLYGTKVVAVNAANNRIVGYSGTSGSTGSWQINDLPQGQIALQVTGRWKLADGSTRRLVDVVGEQDVKVDLDVVPGPEVEDPTVFAPDLKVGVSFDKPSYDISDLVLMTLEVENIGTGAAPARGNWREGPYNELAPSFDYNELRRFLTAPIELWPGESKRFTLTARPRDGGSDPEKLRKLSYAVQVGTVTAEPSENNRAEAHADVTWGTGSASVTVYGDRNMNGRMDAGEELPNAKAGIGGGKPHVNRSGTTDGSGKIRFTDLPAGLYNTYGESDRETGWVSGGGETAVVNPGDEGTALVRLVRPLSDELKVSLRFDKPSYEPGSKAGVVLSITNDSAKSLRVKAECGSSSHGPYLGNDDLAWGDLARTGPGVEIAAGARFDVHIESDMPAGASDYGYVALGCTFGPEDGVGLPYASARAVVPGATQTFTGLVVTGDPMVPTMVPVPNVKIVLLDPETGKPVVSTTTDAHGGWTFPDLAVGAYEPLVVGPWKLMDFGSDGEPFGNVRGREYPEYVWVEPGPEVADPTAGAEAAGPGADGSGSDSGTTAVRAIRNTDALADTGVSVLGLALFGALLVMTGAAMRRRPAQRS